MMGGTGVFDGQEISASTRRTRISAFKAHAALSALREDLDVGVVIHTV